VTAGERGCAIRAAEITAMKPAPITAPLDFARDKRARVLCISR
jgi:hypothetical protein